MLRQTRVLCASHDEKEPDEKNEKAPVHFFIYQVRIACTCDQHDGCADCGHQSRRKTSEEAGQNQCGHKTSLKQRCMVNLYCVHDSLGLDIVKAPTEVEPPEHEPVEEQTHECNRTQVPKEIPVTNARKRPNQDVLWVAGDGRGASDV